MIKRILNWFQAAVPNPQVTHASMQIGCHFEEVSEMAEALGDVDFARKIEMVATVYKNQLEQRLAWVELLSDEQRLATLDALCDQIVTAVGVGYMLGFDMEQALDEVIKSNESKFEHGKPVFDNNGKIKKGKNYLPPELRPFLNKTV